MTTQENLPKTFKKAFKKSLISYSIFSYSPPKKGRTVRFLIHGQHARILARIFGIRSEDRVGVVGGGGGGGEEKYSFTVLEGQKNTVLQFYRGQKIY